MTHPALVRSRIALVTGALVASAFGLTACSVQDLVPVEVTVPDTLVAPGTEVAIGETVRVPGEASKEDNRGASEDVDLGLTVTAIDYPGERLYDKFSNGDKFAGYDPVVISYQVDAPDGQRLFYLKLGKPFGNLSNGEPTSFLDAKELGEDVDEVCYAGSLPTDSSAERECTVLLVPEGETLVRLSWDGRHVTLGYLFDAYEGDPVFPYVENPITFTLPDMP